MFPLVLLQPHVLLVAAGDVIELTAPPGKAFSYKELKESVEKHKPAALFLVQVSWGNPHAMFPLHIPPIQPILTPKSTHSSHSADTFDTINSYCGFLARLPW